MIKFPGNWERIGRKVLAKEVADAVQLCISGLGVRNLSLSGGIDSTTLLYFMNNVISKPINCYTIAFNEKHPDYIHAKLATDFFGVPLHPFFVRKERGPEEAVRMFYEWLNSNSVESIIAGDGIDELACGYYSHLKDRSEVNYINNIRRLKEDHLVPLDENSREVSVYLPYLSPRVIALLSLIPLYEKVDSLCRKKVMVEMARGNIPEEIINRRKFGFCDALSRKGLT